MDPHATAGRIVHYYGGLPAPTAAIVNHETEGDGKADLTVFTPSGPQVRTMVPYSEHPKDYHWSWMPYQKAKAAAAGGNQSESAEPRPSER